MKHEILNISSRAIGVTGNQFKIAKRVMAFAGAAVLLVGCASTDNNGAGGMGNGSETGGSNGRGAPDAYTSPVHQPAVNTGANGSISRSNPFGAGGGSGLTTVK